jgi:hypothetical protein
MFFCAQFPPLLYFYLFIEILLLPLFVVSLCFSFFLFSFLPYSRVFCQFSTNPFMYDIFKACYLTTLSLFKTVKLSVLGESMSREQ